MTEIEAIIVLKMVETHGALTTNAKEMAIKALEKQIPKKPNKAIDSSWGIKREVHVCPVCDYYLTEVHFIDCDEAKEGKKVSYCETCGQAIDYE